MTPKSQLFLVALFFLGLALIFTFPLVLGLDKYVYGSFFNTDIRGGIWHFWWGHYALKSGLDYYHCTFIAAPFGVDFSQQPVSWIVEYLLAAFLLVMTPVFCLNLLTIFSFVLCGLFTYLLVRHVTNNVFVSLFGAIIFTFSPYHLNKVIEFSFFYISNWLVLYAYLLIKLREKLNFKFAFYTALAFTLTIAFNPYYGYIAIIFTLIYFIFCTFYNWRKKIKIFLTFAGLNNSLNIIRAERKYLLILCFILISILLFNMPTFIKILSNLLIQDSHKLLSDSSGYARSSTYLFSQSASLLSYFLPASSHPIFGKFTKNMFGSIFYGRGSIEQTLYLGWLPIVLSYVSFRLWRHRRVNLKIYPNFLNGRENFFVGFFIIVAILGFLFSLPPFLDLIIFKLYFPSFFMHKILPMFRAYARFGVLVSLSVAVLASIGLKYLLDKFKNLTKKVLITLVSCIVILFEFTNIPPLKATNAFVFSDVYKWLSKQDGDFIIAEYPMVKGSPGEAKINYDYLYAQTFHHKRMINGAMPGTKAYEIKQKIMFIDASQTPGILKALGAKYIIFHPQEYKKGDYSDSDSILGKIPKIDSLPGYKFVRSFDDDQVYEIAAQPLLTYDVNDNNRTNQ